MNNPLPRKKLTDLYYQIPSSPVAVGLILAVVGTISGLLLAFGGPIVGVGVLVALIAGLVVLSNMEIGIWGVVGVVCLLPFATLPFKIVITPTFLDLALGGVFAVWVLRLVTGRQNPNHRRAGCVSPAHLYFGYPVCLCVWHAQRPFNLPTAT